MRGFVRSFQNPHMRREPHIPLFLWVTAAIVAHAVGGGGATEVVQRIEETLDIGDFASQVRSQARFLGKPVEISMLTDEALPDEVEAPSENKALPNADNPDADKSEDQNIEDNSRVVKPDELARLDASDEKISPEEKEENKKDPEKLKEKVVDLGLEKDKPLPKPVVVPDRRVAVQQQVEDKDQADNPNAEFAGEHANRVEEQTRAQITSTDHDEKDPALGHSFAGKQPDPGNSDDSRIAQNEESPGPSDRPAGENSAGQSDSARAAQKGQEERPTEATASAGGQKQSPERSSLPGQTAQEAKAAAQQEEAMAETLSNQSGSFSIARAKNAQAAQEAQQARAARPRLPRPQNSRPDALLGFGSNGTTASGVNLNLNPQLAQSIITDREVAELKKRDGERRLSQHRGSWTSVGLERWRPALENYVASVKPGNQTALNTARVPFAAYLNQIHNRLHEIFAYDFLGHLDQLPPQHPLNNQEMSTHLEIALSREDGRIVKMGITKSSGVTAFDVGALEAVKKAAPYGVPPGSIVSSDGNVYLHWEFHRRPEFACSTYFAKPFILNVGQQPAPPRIQPKERTPSEEVKAPEERSGSLEKNIPSAVGRKPT